MNINKTNSIKIHEIVNCESQIVQPIIKPKTFY